MYFVSLSGQDHQKSVVAVDHSRKFRHLVYGKPTNYELQLQKWRNIITNFRKKKNGIVV